jgi:hypothetical protein
MKVFNLRIERTKSALRIKDAAIHSDKNVGASAFKNASEATLARRVNAFKRVCLLQRDLFQLRLDLRIKSFVKA